MKYKAQKKHLGESRRQLRVWLEREKYERLKRKTSDNGVSIYRLVNDFVDSYLGSPDGHSLK